MSYTVKSTIAGMTAITGYANDDVVLVTDQDQGGTFYYDSSSGVSEDEGTVFKADDWSSGNGRWLRVYNQNEPILVGWFGAKPSESATNNTNNIQYALDFMRSIEGGVLLFGQGEYKIENQGSFTDDFTSDANYYSLMINKGSTNAQNRPSSELKPLIMRGMGRGVTSIRYVDTDSRTDYVKVIMSAYDETSPTRLTNHVGFEDMTFTVTNTSDHKKVKFLDFTYLCYSWCKNIAIGLYGDTTNDDSNSVCINVDHASEGLGPYYCYMENMYLSGASDASNNGIKFAYLSSSNTRSANAWTVIGGRFSAFGVAWEMQGVNHCFLGTYIEGTQTNMSAITMGDYDTQAETGVKSSGNVVVGVGFETPQSGTSYATIYHPDTGRNAFVPGYVTGASSFFDLPSTDNTGTQWFGGQSMGNRVDNELIIYHMDGTGSSKLKMNKKGSPYTEKTIEVDSAGTGLDFS